MRIRIMDRILVAVAGILLLGICAGIVAQVFFSVDVIGFIAGLLSKGSQTVKIIAAAGAAVLLLLGLYCFLLLFRHRRRKDKFIIQKMESGDLAISLKAMETMIQKCLDQHKELETQGVHLENQRDGLLIRIRGTVAGGISIPLTIDTLQKQIKQYVTACSGVEVKSIRIQIEASGEDAKDAPFAIDAPTGIPLLRDGERKAADETEPEKEEKSETTEEEDATEIPEKPQVSAGDENAAAAAAMSAAEALIDEYAGEDDRPIHQRLFSTPEEPCIMPLPPENLQQADEEKTAAEEAKEEYSAEDSGAETEENGPEEDSSEKAEGADEA